MRFWALRNRGMMTVSQEQVLQVSNDKEKGTLRKKCSSHSERHHLGRRRSALEGLTGSKTQKGAVLLLGGEEIVGVPRCFSSLVRYVTFTLRN